MTYSTHFNTFVIERDIAASPTLTFSAWATVEAKSQWFAGSEGWHLLDRHFDFREGGSECLEGRWDSGTVSLFRCQYHDIVPNKRIIYTYEMLLNGKRISVSVATIEFTAKGEGTHLKLTEQLVHIDGYPTPEDREVGTRYLVDKAAAYVESL